MMIETRRTVRRADDIERKRDFWRTATVCAVVVFLLAVASAKVQIDDLKRANESLKAKVEAVSL